MLYYDDIDDDDNDCNNCDGRGGWVNYETGEREWAICPVCGVNNDVPGFERTEVDSMAHVYKPGELII